MAVMQMLARRGRSALLLRHTRRHYSAGSAATGDSAPLQLVALDRLAHQSKLQLQISDRARTHVEIIPVLSPSEFALKAFGGDGASSGDVFNVVQEQQEASAAGEPAAVKSVRITKNDDALAGDQQMTLQLFLPHLIDLSVSVVNGSVSVQDKIEGDVKIVVGEGDIRVNKLRGENINLKTNNGRIDVASLIEGEKVKLAAHAVDCKRLMSGSTEIKLASGGTSTSSSSNSGDSDFGAIYSSACVINSFAKGCSLQVGSVHGYLRVTGEEMQKVHVHSVNGAIDLEDSGRSCDAVVHFDSWAADAASTILVGGDVVVSVEPTAPIEVELHGSKIMTDGCAFSESELDQLDVDYAIFSGALKPQAGSSGGAPLAAGASGKINVGSAKNAAMRTSFFMDDSAAGSSETSSSSKSEAMLPRLLVHATSGSVKLEQLDWMAKLKRKHLKQ
ncbi:hypothetical protein Gpo141_00010193 [Globisporangium polare]